MASNDTTVDQPTEPIPIEQLPSPEPDKPKPKPTQDKPQGRKALLLNM